MLEPHQLGHALDHTTIDRLIFSTDHPFAAVDARKINRLFESISDPTDRDAFAGGNAARLLGIS